MESAAITAETVRPLVGSAFSLVGHDVTIELVSVDEQNSDRLNSFALVFEGPTDPLLAQGQWDLDCDGEPFSLFLVPIGPGDNGSPRYESVFSRMAANPE